ncbi:Uncharacterized protein LOCC1_G001333 [Lachnellula occidentalis]|uniref:Uncharacterized protein n=1 Tax=Lachnellula occidentalis TaxID=215460 RepID=A0A8H8UI06_9HELO|nr:Uncharacterized protein LOCC1_G001333 [Lachnellula occidentalis]
MTTQLPFNIANSNAPPPSLASTSFQLRASPSTDIWRTPVPVEADRFNAPILYKSIPLSTFRRTRVTVSANWTTTYDQGGLIFVFPHTKRWIKSGIEFYQDQLFVSTVATDTGADMSLVQTGLRGNKVTLEARSENGALWIYVIDAERTVPIREISWALCGGKDEEIWVGVSAARPDACEGRTEALVVDFEGFELEVV